MAGSRRRDAQRSPAPHGTRIMLRSQGSAPCAPLARGPGTRMMLRFASAQPQPEPSATVPVGLGCPALLCSGRQHSALMAPDFGRVTILTRPDSNQRACVRKRCQTQARNRGPHPAQVPLRKATIAHWPHKADEESSREEASHCTGHNSGTDILGIVSWTSTARDAQRTRIILVSPKGVWWQGRTGRGS